MIYCDTSLLVALVTAEAASDDADRWMRAQAGVLAGSAWVWTEMASALALKRRLGMLDDDAYAHAVRIAEQLSAGMTEVAIERRHFVTAGTRCVTAAPGGLRASDALHLAIVLDCGAGLATLDRKLGEVADRMGIEVAAILSA